MLFQIIYDKNSLDHHETAHQLGVLSDEDQVFISIITLYELEYGYNNASEGKKICCQKRINEAKEDFSILPLTAEGSVLFGRLNKSLVDKRNLKKESAKSTTLILSLPALL